MNPTPRKSSVKRLESATHQVRSIMAKGGRMVTQLHYFFSVYVMWDVMISHIRQLVTEKLTLFFTHASNMFNCVLSVQLQSVTLTLTHGWYIPVSSVGPRGRPAHTLLSVVPVLLYLSVWGGQGPDHRGFNPSAEIKRPEGTCWCGGCWKLNSWM